MNRVCVCVGEGGQVLKNKQDKWRQPDKAAFKISLHLATGFMQQIQSFDSFINSINMGVLTRCTQKQNTHIFMVGEVNQ